MATNLKVQGYVAPGFELVVEAFKENFATGDELGASFCAYHHGVKVVDIWGGGDATGGLWRQDTLCNVYSTTKALGALCVAILADRNFIDYEEKVTKYWPEFGKAGKENLTVATILSHQGGISGIEESNMKLEPNDWYDHAKICRAIENQAPLFEPRTANGYHAYIIGFLFAELVRRCDPQHRTIGQFLKEEVTSKLGADAFIGCPAEEHHRISSLQGSKPVPGQPQVGLERFFEEAKKNGTMKLMRAVWANPSQRSSSATTDNKDDMDNINMQANSKEWREAEIASVNCQANAAGLARIFAALANGGILDGVRIISKTGIDLATKVEVPHGTRLDLVLGRDAQWARGFMTSHPSTAQYGPNPGTFGHSGAGGSLVFADRVANLGVGYVMNQMLSNLNGDPRSLRLIEALYHCIGQPCTYPTDEKGYPVSGRGQNQEEFGRFKSTVLGDVVPNRATGSARL